MGWYKNLSVKVRIPVMMGIASLAVLALVCLLLLIPLRSTSLEDSTEIARLNAIGTAEDIAEKVNGTTNILRAYTGVISQLIESDVVPRNLKRELLLSELKALCDNNLMNNVWCLIEPRMLDGSDSIFSPWFSNKQLTSARHMIDDDLYKIPKMTRREFVSEPYNNEFNPNMRFGISIPIMAHGRFVGVIATGFDISELNDLIQERSNNTLGKLITDQYTVAVHYISERIGWEAEYGNREILDQFSYGRTFEGLFDYEGRQQFKVFVPVSLTKDGNPWYYGVDVPEEMIYQNAQRTAKLLVIYCLIGVVLIALAGWLLIIPILSNVINVTDIISKLSLGIINLQIKPSQNKDEIGHMKNELRRLVGGLQNTADFAQNIGKGNLNAEYQLLSADDVLGNSLLEMRQSLQKAQLEQADHARIEDQRGWGTAGLAKFAELLRSDNDNLEALSYNVISNIVKYLGINQGGMFVLNEAENEEDRVLELQACYAFDRKKFSEKKIHPGEGLVGACFMEGETIYLTDIPDSYVTITSGLGKSNPKSLLICPLKVNDKIFGVLELASFKEIEPHQIEFVEKVGESIAATISTVRVNIRTSHLLDQTKIQAEEMANQEEELRQSMEEMQSTQEEMRRRERDLSETLEQMSEMNDLNEERKHEMQQFHDGIFETNCVVEFSSSGIITSVNQNICDLFGLDKSVFVGKHMSVFIGEEEYRKVLNRLSDGELYQNVQQVNAHGNVLTIKQKFIPISCRKGEFQSAMLLAFHDQEAELRQNMEELRSQEEELRQNMEEIQATLDDANQKEFEIQQFHDGILATNSVVEFSNDGVITEVNQNLCNLFGLDRTVFVGKHMTLFIGEEVSEQVMSHLKDGKVFENVQKVDAGETTLTVRQKFMPIRTKSGDLQYGMMLAFQEKE